VALGAGGHMHCAEYEDLVAAHVDGQLTHEEHARARAHVAACADCARLLETQRALQQTLRARPLIQPTPHALRLAVMAQTTAAQGSRHGSWLLWRPVTRARLAYAGALVLAIIAVALPRLRQTVPASPLLDGIVADYRAAEANRVELSLRTDDPFALRQYYHQTRAFPFTNTVADLEPLGFILQGGMVADLAGRKSTLSVYRGARGTLVCHRISIAGVELPPGGEVIGGDRFYTLGDVTICVHREGDVLCFLATAMPRADFVRLIAGHA
jgi:anti-sigma factor RsiW